MDQLRKMYSFKMREGEFLGRRIHQDDDVAIHASQKEQSEQVDASI